MLGGPLKMTPESRTRARAETYLRVLQQALGVDGAWLALVHGHKGVRVYAEENLDKPLQPLC